ncbi:MAG: Gfo/Idh/MocA family oxidoreductase [Kiritimatiellaeota bacterium]|nr:Gfo/Idh/MocA family oxidoreductase [Kiritimatiellota bacterium]
MADEVRVAVIGLDTSHSIQFSRRMNAPDCPAEQKVDGLTAVTCLRFETPFQDREGLDKRQAELEAWGVKVTEDFDEAVADCDAIMLEINDPAAHLEYFRRVADLGKPVFLDKPLAGTLEDGRAIVDLARRCGTRVWSGSSLPFTPGIIEAAAQVPDATIGQVFGAMGTAPAGDSLVWYGVHTFEMLQRLMGMGACSVWAVEDETGVVAVVEYGAGRRGLVEAVRGMWHYGGRAQSRQALVQFRCDMTYAYRDLLREVRAFFLGGPAPVPLARSFEGLAMMIAARRAIETGKQAVVAALDA